MYMVLESLVIDVGGGRLRALVVPDYEQAENEGVDKNDLPGIMHDSRFWRDFIPRFGLYSFPVLAHFYSLFWHGWFISTG